MFSLIERRAPWVAFAAADDPHVATELEALRAGGGLALRIDGTEFATERGAYRALARALEFPGHFGNNCYALVDCLGDLHHDHFGGPRDIAVIVDGADGLLGADHLPIVILGLAQGAERANLQMDDDGWPSGHPPIALHFAFLLAEVPPIAFSGVVDDKDVDIESDGPRLVITSFLEVSRPED